MNILLLGSGAREHAAAEALFRSPEIGKLFALPGNAGTARVAENIPIEPPKFDASERDIARFFNQVEGLCEEKEIKFVVPLSEVFFFQGIVDFLTDMRRICFGPSKAAAEIETSKIFSYELMRRHGILQPAGRPCYSPQEARRNWGESTSVIKADGLAQGKGVFLPTTRGEAMRVIKELMEDGILGDTGRKVLLQERLSGCEVSAHAFTDGSTVRHLPFSCDYKRFTKDPGSPNTGGVGAYSPAVWLGNGSANKANAITTKLVEAMAEEGNRFKGVVYPGLIVPDEPKVLEVNCRLGDPETQVLLPRLQGDLLEILLACTGEGDLSKVPINWSQQACVCVVLCSRGYPGKYETGLPITGLDKVSDDVMIFHAGTKLEDDGTITTNGGRVLSVVALAGTIEKACGKVYDAIGYIDFEGMVFSKEIGENIGLP